MDRNGFVVIPGFSRLSETIPMMAIHVLYLKYLFLAEALKMSDQITKQQQCIILKSKCDTLLKTLWNSGSEIANLYARENIIV